ncbi:DUF5685 family protein [Xiamenia xianingshaonis]|uniref:DUF5685 family protein n=1 Tax=Xiamenia xianingshaonis TaxID=2682776 RepID=UPI0028F6C4EE|nr:DUF5685 family protein [Xiamenia xianingshaonis]
MFGFVTPSLSSLSDAEQARYKAVYCGLCRALGRQTGQRTRLVLSYDMVLLALVLGSMDEAVEREGAARCLMHPLEPRPYVTSASIEYAADMTVALAYHKCFDDWRDDRNVKARLAASALDGPYAKVRTRRPRQCAAAENAMAAIADVERRGLAAAQGEPACLDEAANLFGALMGELFVCEDGFFASDLRRFGARLGKFVYVMDAVVDLDDDRASGSYNPLAHTTLTAEAMREYLGVLAHLAADAFERLPLERDVHVMRSVLYGGMWQGYQKKRQDGGASVASEQEGSRGDGPL